MIRYIFIILILQSLTTIAYTSDDQEIVIKIDYDRIYEIVLEIKELKRKGIDLHKNYNLNDIDQLKQCVQTNNYLRNEAKKLTEETNKIGSFFYKVRLHRAAWKAFECVYCGDALNSCYDIQPFIDETIDLLKQDGFKLPIVFINDIAKKDKSFVETIIGSGKNCHQTNVGELCEFMDGAIEINFIWDEADWITIHRPPGVHFLDNAITSIGLAPRPPTFKNGNVIRWKNIDGLLEVQFFPGENNMVSYVYIKAMTD